MVEAEKGAFSLIDYKIKQFAITEPNDEKVELSVAFNPSGQYFKSTNQFVLKFKLSILHGVNAKTEFISAVLEATFKFDTDVKSGDQIPKYFYVNAIAIIFPYMRAFVTNLTAVANIKPLILPLLNLTFLESEFKENTQFLD